MQLSEANIIITGAGSGFGKSMATHFAEQNAQVYAVDINENALTLLKAENDSIQTFVCDITDNTRVEKAIDEIFLSDSKTNILINNAGIMKNAPLINILQRPDSKHNLDLWHRVIDINQHAVFYTTRAFADQMIKKRNKGVIINISSIAATGNAGQTAYSASKAAVEAMTKVWAKELGVFGIRAVAIAPGFIDTAGTHDALEEKMLNRWVEQTPLKRTGKIEEIVSAVRFVIENDFINGEIIRINGGLTI
jgi:3-oxoacyl-[acyl-carrier protein] reductase